MKIIKSVSLLCCIAALCFSLVPSLHAADLNFLINKTNQSDLITKACAFAEDKGFCESNLKEQPASHDPDTNMGGLAVISIKVAQANAMTTLDEINKKLNASDAGTLDPVTEQNLEDCQEHYESAMEQLDNALAALTLKKLSESKIMVAAAMTDADSCEDGFKQRNQNSLLGQSNGEFQKNCEVVLAVLRQTGKEALAGTLV